MKSCETVQCCSHRRWFLCSAVSAAQTFIKTAAVTNTCCHVRGVQSSRSETRRRLSGIYRRVPLPASQHRSPAHMQLSADGRPRVNRKEVGSVQKPLNCGVMGETSGDTNTQKTCADMTATFLPFPPAQAPPCWARSSSRDSFRAEEF